MENSNSIEFILLTLKDSLKNSQSAPLNLEDMERCHESLEQEIATKKTELSKTISENKSVFETFEAEVSRFDQEIDSALKNLKELEKSWLSSQNSYLKDVKSDTNEINTLNNDLLVHKKVIAVLDFLHNIKLHLDISSSAILGKRLLEAAQEIVLLDQILIKNTIGDSIIIKKIKNQIRDMKLNIQEISVKLIIEAIEIYNNSSTFSLKINLSENSRLDIFAAYKILGFLDSLTDIIHKTICIPFIVFCSSDSIELESSKDELLIKKCDKGSKVIDSLDENSVKSVLVAFFEFLRKRLFTDEYITLIPKSVKIELENELWLSIISNCFSLERAFKENSWDSLKSDALEVEKAFQKCGALEIDNALLLKFAETVEPRYASIKSQKILELVRKSILRPDFKEILTSKLNFPEIENKEYYETSSLENTPTFAVTESTYEVTKYLYDLCILYHHSLNIESKHIFLDHIYTCVGIYCSLRYNAHKLSIKKVGYLSILCYNDNLFLALHLNNIYNIITQNKAIQADSDVLRYEKKQKFYYNELLVEAYNYLNEMILRLHSEIKDLLMTCEDFDSASDSKKREKIISSVKKIKYFINNTANSITFTKDSLPRHVYNMIIGSAINNLFENVYFQIMSANYISAEDSKALKAICEEILGIEDLILLENEKLGWESKLSQQQLNEYIPMLSKFIQLKDIMILSISEIGERYKLGFFNCFENIEDLVKLVQMLFEDSDRRDTLVDILQQIV
ncbi:hypothetical protein BB561_000891 [Smittium simulii]|uniref:ZW10 C-terminal helical domain-containing protein n=1 Tax=Smittium simulii TaxID=133385 RepID=A0A2T9YX65_9FUNG|nr:hypothetical protein BB561_000891 [Smittium simulii]